MLSEEVMLIQLTRATSQETISIPWHTRELLWETVGVMMSRGAMGSVGRPKNKDNIRTQQDTLTPIYQRLMREKLQSRKSSFYSCSSCNSAKAVTIVSNPLFSLNIYRNCDICKCVCERFRMCIIQIIRYMRRESCTVTINIKWWTTKSKGIL